MSFSHWIMVVAVALLPLAATAQQGQQPSPADVNAAVAETSYVSSFKNYITTPEESTSPDQVWRAANEEVGRSDPHAGHGSHGAMTGMPTQPAGQQAGSVQPDPHAAHRAMPSMTATPATQKPRSTQPDPHAGHGVDMTTPAPAPAKADPHAGRGGHNH